MADICDDTNKIMKVAWVLNSHFVFSSLSIDASKLVVNTNGTIVKIEQVTIALQYGFQLH